MSDDSGKLELAPPFHQVADDLLHDEIAAATDKPWKTIHEPDISAGDCCFGDWLFSSKELVLRNIRKKKTIRLANLNTSERLLSSMLALSLQPGYQPSQFVFFLDAIVRHYFSKSIVDAFCLGKEETSKLDWEAVRSREHSVKVDKE